MTARLLDGTALSTRLRDGIAARVGELSRHGATPGLAVVLVGDDPASQIYVRNKIRACDAAGIRSVLRRLPADVAEAEVLAVIDALNRDDDVHGILVQMPLPPQVAPNRVIEAVALEKDVDGFHLRSAGALLQGRVDDGIGFRPCTPHGVIRLLDDGAVPIAGRHAVVIGRSNTVGKPMALMLLARDATVTLCHSATRDLPGIVRTGDIVVAAVGRPSTVSADMVKPGAAVVDVGMNRDAAGKLVGDVDFGPVREVAGWITPVPGGVGPMTIAVLLDNTVLSAERRRADSSTPRTR